MRISVIVPYHGEKGYLKECLDSLADQEFRDFEVIVINDHSKINEEKIKLRYEGKLNLSIHALADGKYGVAAARNRGMELAQGAYIYFLDADDYLYEGAFSKLVETIDSKEDEVEVAYGKRVISWFRRSVFVPILDERIAAKNQENGGELDEFDEETVSNEDEETDEEVTLEEGTDGEEGVASEGGTKRLAETKHHKIYSLPIEGDSTTVSGWLATECLFRNRSGFRAVSVLNVLFRKDFLECHQIRFHEDLLYNCDFPFMVEVLVKGKSFARSRAAIYIKRQHNDPIHDPSLSQVSDESRFEEFVRSFELAKELVSERSFIDYVLVRKMIDYYCNTFSLKLRRCSDKDRKLWMGPRFDRMKALFLTFDKIHFKPLRKYKRRAVKALLKKNSAQCLKVTNRHLARKKISRFIHKKGELSRYLYKYYFSKMKLKENYVVFESFFGKSYSDSPKYIYEYIMKNCKELGLKPIWSYSDRRFSLPYGGKRVKRYGLRYSYYMGRSKYFVFNVRQPYWFVKRNDQVFLETWHGTPLKKLFFDMDEVYSASRLAKKQVYTQSNEWDYLIAPNLFSSKVFRSCFAFENEMLETGYPRNDLMHAPNRDEIAAVIRKRIGVPEGKKTILYAPTWRDDEYYGKGKYKFTLKLDLERMKKQLGDEYVILLRTHYYIADSLDVTGVEDFAINVSKYNDITELYLISDVLITDYSSVFFDFANLRRPMLFFVYDLDKYRDILRGFYIDIEEELPGPLLKTNDEVLEAFQRLPEIIKENEEKYDRFYEKYCGLENGTASQRVVERMFKQ